jgi:hypothetical protein
MGYPDMTDRTTMLALAERAEKAEGPDREFDRLIAFVVGHKHGRIGEWANSHNGDYVVIEECAAAYTASIDAALTLKAPHTLWATGSMEEGPFARLCWPQPDGSYLGGYFEAKAATPALALVAACLRARAEGGVDE